MIPGWKATSTSLPNEFLSCNPPSRGCRYLVLVWEEEWQILSAIYSPDHVITAVYNESAILITEPGE